MGQGRWTCANRSATLPPVQLLPCLAGLVLTACVGVLPARRVRAQLHKDKNAHAATGPAKLSSRPAAPAVLVRADCRLNRAGLRVSPGSTFRVVVGAAARLAGRVGQVGCRGLAARGARLGREPRWARSSGGCDASRTASGTRWRSRSGAGPQAGARGPLLVPGRSAGPRPGASFTCSRSRRPVHVLEQSRRDAGPDRGRRSDGRWPAAVRWCRGVRPMGREA